MRIGMGLALTDRYGAGGGGAAAFNPATALFGSSEVGFWFDPSDLSTMWQDVAGTTPVTAAGQSVARIDDKSGNGNNATQSTAANQPVYQTSGGLHWLDFDGTDDAMQVSAFAPGTDKMQIFCGLENEASATNIVVESSANSGSNNGTFLLFLSSSAITFRSKGTTQRDSANADSSLDTRVLTGLGDISGDSAILRINGVAEATNTDDQGTGDYLSYAINIGARNGVSFETPGKFYSLALRFAAPLSSDVISDMEDYVAEKSGVSF